MREHQILAHIAKQIVEERGAYERAVTSGTPKDYAEYKNLCGIIQGLNLAERTINDLVQKMEKSDE